MKFLKHISFLIYFSGVALSLNAQSIGPATLNATGGSTVIGANIYDWSVGEMTMVSTFTGTNIIVTQGVLQPFDGTTGVANTILLTNLKIFPNPASDVVNLQYTSDGLCRLTYNLLDLTGKVIINHSNDVKQGTITEQVNISGLAVATYILDVSIARGNNSPEIVAYKIQKLQ